MHTPALDALAKFAASKPGLQFANYGNSRSYNRESRRIRADLRRFQALHLEALQIGVTDRDVLDAAPRAFSGRLHFIGQPVGYVRHLEDALRHAQEFSDNNDNAEEIERLREEIDTARTTPEGYTVDYTTGQYYPTEYRPAACAVLAQAISTRRQANPPQYPESDLPNTIQEAKARNKAAGLHYFDTDNSRFFNSRLHGMPFPGCLLESIQFKRTDSNGGPDLCAPRQYRPVFIRANGETWRNLAGPTSGNFPTLAQARKKAHRMNKAGEIKWKAEQ